MKQVKEDNQCEFINNETQIKDLDVLYAVVEQPFVKAKMKTKIIIFLTFCKIKQSVKSKYNRQTIINYKNYNFY